MIGLSRREDVHNSSFNSKVLHISGDIRFVGLSPDFGGGPAIPHRSCCARTVRLGLCRELDLEHSKGNSGIEGRSRPESNAASRWRATPADSHSWETLRDLRSSYARNEVKRVVIVGGGFAGLNCAQTLAGHDEIHVTPTRQEQLSAVSTFALPRLPPEFLSPDNAAFNLRAVLAAHQNVDIKMTEIVSVDLATRTAYSSDGDTYQGDYLVLAAGAQANFFGIPGCLQVYMPLVLACGCGAVEVAAPGEP